MDKVKKIEKIIKDQQAKKELIQEIYTFLNSGNRQTLVIKN
jgi:hypothetical protein